MMKEDEYSEKVVMPLLRRMGFIDVRNNHGINEFGKDILFSKYDEFGIKKHYAAQLKAKNISGKNAKDMDDIIAHIGRAYNIPHLDLITGESVFIDEFYVITSKEFIGNAITMIREDERIRKQKNYLHFFDGEKIHELDNNNYKIIKERIEALISEMRYNSDIINFINNNIEDWINKGKVPLENFRIINLDKFIEQEHLSEQINYKLFYELWRSLSIQNNILNQIRLFGFGKYNKDTLLNNTKNLKELLNILIPVLQELVKTEY